MAKRVPKLIANPAKPTAGRRNTGNRAIQLYKGEPDGYASKFDMPMHRFFERVPRPDLEASLALSTEKRYTEFLRIMNHPKVVSEGWSMTRIAKWCGLTLVDLTKFWRDSRMQQAMLTVSEAIPAVMQDIAADARNRPMPCPRCDGYGTLLDARANNPDYPVAFEDTPAAASYDGQTFSNSKEPLRACPECNGNGHVTARGDSEARKILLEAGGVTGKRAPVIMNQHNHFPGSVENFVDKWDSADADDVKDAEFEDMPKKKTEEK